MIKAIAKALLAATPYRLVRDHGANRFDGFDSCFGQLKALGYQPRQIIDCGAHTGQFALFAHGHFPAARLDMVEPQPACQAALNQLAQAKGFGLHPVAAGSPKDAIGGGLNFTVSDAPTTGAHVSTGPATDEMTVMVEVATLDSLFAGTIELGDRTLLKLDLQGYELQALAGAMALLPLVEVVLTEVSFFQQATEPTVPALIAFFDKAGFDLFDVASLHGRTRDNRLRQGDFVFVRRGAALSADTAWA